MVNKDLGHERWLVELLGSSEEILGFEVSNPESIPGESEPDIIRLSLLCELIQEASHTNLLNDDSFQQLASNALTSLDLTSDGEVRLYGVSLSRIENWACGDELPPPSVRRVFSRWIIQRAEEEVELAGG